MIIDALLLFEPVTGRALTSGTVTSTNILDLYHVTGGVSGTGWQRDIGVGDDPAMDLVIGVSVGFTGGTSIAFNLQTAPDGGAGTPGTFVTLAGVTVPTAGLTVGQEALRIKLPLGIQRFLQLQYVITGTYTAGQITAEIVIDRQALGPNLGYPSGFSTAGC